MRIQLPDVNVLLAYLNNQHPHHQIAEQWFDGEGKANWATCPMTESGFLRLRTQYLKNTQSGEFVDALFELETMKQNHRTTYTFWSDTIGFDDPTLFDAKQVAGHKQVTDSYLLGLCQQNGGTLVTLDKGMNLATIIQPHPDLLRVLPVP